VAVVTVDDLDGRTDDSTSALQDVGDYIVTHGDSRWSAGVSLGPAPGGGVRVETPIGGVTFGGVGGGAAAAGAADQPVAQQQAAAAQPEQPAAVEPLAAAQGVVDAVEAGMGGVLSTIAGLLPRPS
jgi:hypothetical protein